MAGGVSFSGSGSWSSGHRLFMDATNGLSLYGDAGSANDFIFGNSAGTTWLTLPTGTTNPNFAGSINLGAGKGYKIGGVQVVGTQQAAIADHSSDATVNLILAALRNHGIIAT